MNGLLEMARLVERLRAIPGATDATVRVDLNQAGWQIGLCLTVHANRRAVSRRLAFDLSSFRYERPGLFPALVETMIADAIEKLKSAVREAYGPFDDFDGGKPLVQYAPLVPPPMQVSKVLGEKIERMMAEAVRPYPGVERVGNEHMPEFADEPTVVEDRRG